jgi:hypothetical protein
MHSLTGSRFFRPQSFHDFETVSYPWDSGPGKAHGYLGLRVKASLLTDSPSFLERNSFFHPRHNRLSRERELPARTHPWAGPGREPSNPNGGQSD